MLGTGIIHQIARSHLLVLVEIRRCLLHGNPELVDQIAAVDVPLPEEPEFDEFHPSLHASLQVFS